VMWAFERGAAVARVHEVRGAVATAELLSILRRATPDGVAA